MGVSLDLGENERDVSVFLTEPRQPFDQEPCRPGIEEGQIRDGVDVLQVPFAQDDRHRLYVEGR